MANQIVISNSSDKKVQILDQNGQLMCDIKSPAAGWWQPNGLCCTEDDEIYISSYSFNAGIYRYSSETGAYLGCITKDVKNPVGLALSDDGDRILVAQDTSVKILKLE